MCGNEKCDSNLGTEVPVHLTMSQGVLCQAIDKVAGAEPEDIQAALDGFDGCRNIKYFMRWDGIKGERLSQRHAGHVCRQAAVEGTGAMHCSPHVTAPHTMRRARHQRHCVRGVQ